MFYAAHKHSLISPPCMMPRRASPSRASVLYTRNHARQCAIRTANARINSRAAKMARHSHMPEMTLGLARGFFVRVGCREMEVERSLAGRACTGVEDGLGVIWPSGSLGWRWFSSSWMYSPWLSGSDGKSRLATPVASISLPDLRGGVGGRMRHSTLSFPASTASSHLGNGGSQGFLPGSLPSTLPFPFPSTLRINNLVAVVGWIWISSDPVSLVPAPLPAPSVASPRPCGCALRDVAAVLRCRMLRRKGDVRSCSEDRFSARVERDSKDVVRVGMEG